MAEKEKLLIDEYYRNRSKLTRIDEEIKHVDEKLHELRSN